MSLKFDERVEEFSLKQARQSEIVGNEILFFKIIANKVHEILIR